MHPERYKTQMNAYSKLIAGTVFLLHEEFGSKLSRSRYFGDEIAGELIKFETQLAKVGAQNILAKINYMILCLYCYTARYKAPEK